MDTYIANVSPMLQCPFVTSSNVEELSHLLEDNYFYYGYTSNIIDNWNIAKSKEEGRYYISKNYVGYMSLLTGEFDVYCEYYDTLDELLHHVPVDLKRFVIVNIEKGQNTIKQAVESKVIESSEVAKQLLLTNRDNSFLQA